MGDFSGLKEMNYYCGKNHAYGNDGQRCNCPLHNVGCHKTNKVVPHNYAPSKDSVILGCPDTLKDHGALKTLGTIFTQGRCVTFQMVCIFSNSVVRT
jgi:hypothetical protein